MWWANQIFVDFNAPQWSFFAKNYENYENWYTLANGSMTIISIEIIWVSSKFKGILLCIRN